jgi:hypothetical protein
MTIDKNFVAPALPVPPLDYDQRYSTELIRILRLYFNLNDNYTTNVILDALNGGVGGNGITFPHIAASDATDQVATGNNTATLVQWSALTSGYLWTLNSPGSATAGVAGVYKINYSLQLINTANAEHDVNVWLRVNNVDIANSTTAFTVPARKSTGNPSYTVAYSEVTFEIDAGDEIKLYWATDLAGNPTTPTDGVYIYHDAAQVSPYARPAIPSAIGSITYVSALSPT